MKRLSRTLRKFRDEQELLRLAYIDRKGYPCVIPLWYVVIGGSYYVGTGVTSHKWKAIQKNPCVGWVIDGGKPGKYKGISLQGRAEEVTDRRLRAAAYHALSMKYFGSPAHPKFVEIYGQVDDEETVYLRLSPESGFSWEY
jgi:nitroimidazol reductase NimA-like FMN-containing flavoprotein (pyridoxamine 5'-phosphate oxidase superfamily)